MTKNKELEIKLMRDKGLEILRKWAEELNKENDEQELLISEVEKNDETSKRYHKDKRPK
ncbi:hypothetical protein [Anaerobacillus arseniciselenatis]|uniref:hypothetical protein n=1 Tax=Anaerobacillus arseniciselenatis TaxID=85682 RepID=UPI001470AF41|nr:hypothetical protein [Anaerobacillus arseniciselenatis]